MLYPLELRAPGQFIVLASGVASITVIRKAAAGIKAVGAELAADWQAHHLSYWSD
jgi:hypothetical protein